MTHKILKRDTLAFKIEVLKKVLEASRESLNGRIETEEFVYVRKEDGVEMRFVNPQREKPRFFFSDGVIEYLENTPLGHI